MAPLTIDLLARDEVASSNALKVPVAGQTKVAITRKLAMERFDVLKIAVDAGHRPCMRQPFGRVVQDDRLAGRHAVATQSRPGARGTRRWITDDVWVASRASASRVSRRQHLPTTLGSTSTQQQWGFARSDFVKIWPNRIKNSFRRAAV